MLSHPIFTPSHLSMSVFTFACIFGAARAFEFDFEFGAKCADTYCSKRNNGQYINNGDNGENSCCTFGSASECSCCLPNHLKPNPYGIFCSASNYPTWESCVSNWSDCCGSFSERPSYEGVDWVSDASCCQLCNGGTWAGVAIDCDPKVTPQLLCSSKDDSDNTMLRHGVKAEE
mmetsp:Transcript_54572/g.81278  ORF Transcript_54572/g.81278 Transcript_54572/m.81278 type:complete len:174 (-) Transcript_54572:47-568(-)